jgi:EAL domain-containing protein (putative c-di-GMP-specific phosphodiesterase class I)
MDRPKYVSDAIETSPEGLHVGRYGPLQLFSAYQPIFAKSPEGLRLSGYEGLVRARREGQAVSPEALFSNVDDGDQLFVECLCRALHLRNYTMAQPGGLDLFININPAIYASVDIVEREFDFMFSILRKYGLSPNNLVCEIIETDALSTETLERLCAKLRSGGARLAVDDFGAGKSGIERYRALKPDVVKIDGEMFRDIAADRNRLRMFEQTARTFVREGTVMLVEGIETAAQLQVAIDIGATLFQGYALAKPAVLPTMKADNNKLVAEG